MTFQKNRFSKHNIPPKKRQLSFALQAFEEFAEAVQNKRLLMPEEIASNIIHLASDEAKGMNGSMLVIDYGMTL